MKYLKTYETVKHLSEINKNDLEVGDYVLLNCWYHPSREFMNFVNTNIGQISDTTSLKINITVEYENVPTSIQKHFSERKKNIFSRPFHSNEIEYVSKDKEKLKMARALNKYNI